MERLHRENRIDGVIGMGGSGGSSLVSRALRRLPVGVPKLLISTMVSGDVSAYVDTSDLTMTDCEPLVEDFTCIEADNGATTSAVMTDFGGGLIPAGRSRVSADHTGRNAQHQLHMGSWT